MKKLILSTITLCLVLVMQAQAPEKFNYQAVIRDSLGSPLANKTVSFRISIIKTTNLLISSTIYTETLTVTSNDQGIITLKVGAGDSDDDFSAIDWGATLLKASTMKLKVEMDTAGSTDYEAFSTSQLVSVPYAMYSKDSENSDNSDALNGQDSSYYLNAGNMNDGTLSTDRYSAYTDLNAEGRLNNDVSSDILTRSQADLRYHKEIGFNVVHQGTQDIEANASSYVKVLFTSETFDLGDDFNTTTSQYTAAYSGIYVFSSCLTLDIETDVNNYAVLAIEVLNEQLYILDGEYQETGETGITTLSGSITLYLEAGDIVHLLAKLTADDGYVAAGGYFSGHLISWDN